MNDLVAIKMFKTTFSYPVRVTATALGNSLSACSTPTMKVSLKATLGTTRSTFRMMLKVSSKRWAARSSLSPTSTLSL